MNDPVFPACFKTVSGCEGKVLKLCLRASGWETQERLASQFFATGSLRSGQVSAERRRGQMKDWPVGAHIELIKAGAVSGYLPAAPSHLRTQTDRQASLRIRLSNTKPVTPVPVL